MPVELMGRIWVACPVEVMVGSLASSSALYTGCCVSGWAEFWTSVASRRASLLGAFVCSGEILSSCAVLARHVQLCLSMEACIHLQRSFLSIYICKGFFFLYIVTFLGNSNCSVCLIVFCLFDCLQIAVSCVHHVVLIWSCNTMALRRGKTLKKLPCRNYCTRPWRRELLAELRNPNAFFNHIFLSPFQLKDVVN